MNYPNKLIEDLLQKFKPVLGEDFDKYKNHVYRVFLNALQLDNAINNEIKYAITAVFHDIGIWTQHTFDYLGPSISQVRVYLEETGKREWIEEITHMIFWHHKISAYNGAHEHVVETFRKADWMDISLGLLNFGASKTKIEKIRRILPNQGFHWFLVRQTIKNFFKHPLNPIPVFKR